MLKQGVEIERSRIKYAVGIFAVILLGLASRSDSPLLPGLVKEYAGDTLWALVAYLSVGFLFPRLSIWKVALIAGIFSFSVELSQLYHAAWIENIRRFRLGGLLLGYGFLWSDLICYSAGISLGVLFESVGASRLFSGRRSQSK
ncbi:MAG: DUF2809 domain-containing protein [Actinomycetota bacterium]